MVCRYVNCGWNYIVLKMIPHMHAPLGHVFLALLQKGWLGLGYNKENLLICWFTMLSYRGSKSKKWCGCILQQLWMELHITLFNMIPNMPEPFREHILILTTQFWWLGLENKPTDFMIFYDLQWLMIQPDVSKSENGVDTSIADEITLFKLIPHMPYICRIYFEPYHTIWWDLV